MRRNLAEFEAARASDGIAVVHEPLKAKGFPFFLRGVADGLSIARGDDRYECARLFVDALPYAMDRIIFSCGGEQRVVTSNSVWNVNAPDGRASIERDKRRGWMIRIETRKATALSNDLEASVGAATINLAPHESGSGAIDVSMRVLEIGVTRPASGFAVDRIDAALTISGVASDLDRSVEIHGLEAVICDTIVKAEGAISAPSGGAARGRLDARIEKPAGLARLLGEARLLNPEEAVAAENGLAMLSVASGGAVSAPLELADGEIRLAGFRLARIGRTVQP